MKKTLLLAFIFFQHFAYCQIKTFTMTGNDYVRLHYSTLYFFEQKGDSLRETSYNYYYNHFAYAWNPRMVKSIDFHTEFPTLTISNLDAGFDALKELAGKVYFVNDQDSKDFYFFKDDSTLVRKAIQKQIIWKTKEAAEYKVYRLDLGNDRFIYTANGLGIIYKMGGEIKTNFLPLEYYYKYAKPNTITIKAKDSVNMETGYFEFGVHKIYLKQDATAKNKNDAPLYTVKKGNEIVLDDLSIKYYNNNSLIVFNNKSLQFFDSNLNSDSQFNYRTMHENNYNLEFLVNNTIKVVPTRCYTAAFEKHTNGVCGTVAHYALQLNQNNATLTTDARILAGGVTSRNIPIISRISTDSMVFTTHKNQMNWNENGGFNDRIILYKNGKTGLYSFKLTDSLTILDEILPIEFDNIYLLNAREILIKSGLTDFVAYYLKEKKMRFKQISYETYSYLRYKKKNNTEGWVDVESVLFDDK